MRLRGACFLWTLLVLMSLPAVYSGPCPRSCSCPQPTELHCTFRSLVSIPSTVSKHVERMNLGSVQSTDASSERPVINARDTLCLFVLFCHCRFNSINTITDRSLAGLRKLELLMMHGNNIHSLPDGAFRDLTSLQVNERTITVAVRE